MPLNPFEGEKRVTRTTAITAIYEHSRAADGRTYACYFDVPHITTNGVDCDTPEIEAALVSGLTAALRAEATAFYVANGLPASDVSPPHVRVLGFYTNQRPKALINRPIVIGG